ncbi:MAG: ATP-binding protein [Thermodesulfobacteriota bacterium]
MSRAGVRSSQGDEYQRLVALHWLVRLLGDTAIRDVQAESLGLPGEGFPVSADDVVVRFEDGRVWLNLIKKNQPRHRVWGLSDGALADDLRKARDQLEVSSTAQVWLYSRTPFGELASLIEDCRAYPDHPAFARGAPGAASELLGKVAQVLERPPPTAFALLARVRIADHHGFEAWERLNREAMDRLAPHPDRALAVLRAHLDRHQTKLGEHAPVITRDALRNALAAEGIQLAPHRSEDETLALFRNASAVGRHWPRTIAGEPIRRPELDRVISLLEQGCRTIMVTDGPGTGKTCLLLDLADHIEKVQAAWALLFLKADLFAAAETEADLVARGLPDDLVGRCARLAAVRPVVVVIDSLDVLSIGRQQRALRVFLSLMDRLERTRGVSLVAACREFDLQYDPVLRGRAWQETIRLEPLPFPEVVAPLLRRWQVEPESLTPALRALLVVPENLRVFERLVAMGGVPAGVATAWQLHDRYLDEIVGRDACLGTAALAVLETMARNLARARGSAVPRRAVAGDEAMVQRLESQGILHELAPGRLGFAHQTLLETILVRRAFAQGQDLCAFILAHPPLPFIRPTIRSFFFALRATDRARFRRQVRAAVAEQKVVYHLKRLLVESLAELVPEAEDWPLCRFLFHEMPDLFRRLLWRVNSPAWLLFLREHWLPAAKATAGREEWLLDFLRQSRQWATRCPAEVLGLWREALQEGWGAEDDVARSVIIGLADFAAWHTPGVEDLFTILIEKSADRHLLGHPLSRWVAATDGGDALLWRSITRNVDDKDISPLQIRSKLHCDPHTFDPNDFLARRLLASDALLDLVLEDLRRWSQRAAKVMVIGAPGLYSFCLTETSWEDAREWFDHGRHVGSFVLLLIALEEALKDRARRDTEWWRAHEPQLRYVPELGLRYLLIQAYRQAVETNIPGMEAQLTDKALVRDYQLGYELGLLMREAYPHVSDEARLANQAIILALWDDPEWRAEREDEWAARTIYNYLIRIPAMFRTPEAQGFLDHWARCFGRFEPKPRLRSWGGLVGSPLTVDEMLGLSDQGVLRLLDHYQLDPERREMTDRGYVGGWTQVEQVLRDAAARDPLRFLGLLSDRLSRADGDPGYGQAIVTGAADHLAIRFETLQSSRGWQPLAPLPEAADLARNLLGLLDRPPLLGRRDRDLAWVLGACTEVLEDEASLARLVLRLLDLSRSPDPTVDDDSGPGSDLERAAFNSVRGMVAGTAVRLCNRLLDQELYSGPRK